MTDQAIYIVWAILFVICAGLGFIPEPEGAVKAFMTVLSAAFFGCPGWLLYRARQNGNLRTRRILRDLSLLSLGLTLLLLIGNLLSVRGSEQLGLFLHYLLTVVSTPMICSGSWALSLFLWACILMLSLRKR